MKQLLLLYRFNPYHNRRIVRYSTINEYYGNPNNEAEHIAAGSYIFCAYPKNFAYRDGVDTLTTVTLDNALETPDYCLVINQTTQEIESRWFVMDSDLYSGSSTKLTLHRDMIADYYEEVLTAPCFIEKATLNPADPFIFNSENITVNRIKKGETLIQDRSKCAWVVGYLAPNTADTSIDSVEAVDTIAGYTNTTEFFTTFPYHNFVRFGSYQSDPLEYEEAAGRYHLQIGITKTNYVGLSGYDPYGQITYYWNKGEAAAKENQQHWESVFEMYGTTGLVPNFKMSSWLTWADNANNLVKNALNNKRAQIQNGANTYFNLSVNPTNLAPYDGKNVKIGDNYYKLVLKYNLDTSGTYTKFPTGTANDIVNGVKGMSCWDSVEDSASNDALAIKVDKRKYFLEVQEISSNKLHISYTNVVKDCGKLPYKMFCMPYSTNGDITIRYGTAEDYTEIAMAQDTAIAAAKAISAKFTGAQILYDIQLLPYCPDQSIIVDDHIILMSTDSSVTTLITDGEGNNIGAIHWCVGNSGTFNVSHSITVNNVKMDSITEMYRISSPNWNGQFEFNAAKNGGVTTLNVDFTYKPHCPYIHINPNFGRLYGQDFDDARGLICAGDFSLPQTSEAWNTYEIQNKNYQNQFQRDIDNLELTQSIQMKQQKFAAITGLVSGAISGATAGASVGGVPGAIAGALGGTALSAVGAQMDYKYQKQLNEEAIDYRQDQFGFQLENIKALPQNLTNVGGLTANNKIWPVVEHYSCTDEEKQALELKLYYNGMTVERIGTMADFLQEDYSYIKGKLIRLTINEDNHFIEMIANEINRGVFIK